MKKKQYITTTLPYVNAKPHVGFAMEIIRADALARYKKLMGYEVYFNTGTDEHGMKIYENAQKNNVSPQEYVDNLAIHFKGLIQALGISKDIHFVRTTEKKHIHAAQEFWKRCQNNGFIYKKKYQAKYCVGCELNKTDSELVDGKCPDHPTRDIVFIDEENYFFRFSETEGFLKELYKTNPNFVVPDFRFNEIKKFLERGLKDFSISRLKEKMPWGIPVPGDEEHVMYVWFDALVNYISTLDWPENDIYKKYWEEGNPIQYCGKDNLRQQSAMWQSMLYAAGLSPSKKIIVNGFIISDGKKMSKSLGNVIDPYSIVDEYGVDALRYYLLRHVNSFEDSDVTMEKFFISYNANLANGLGNLVQRSLNMIVKYEVDISDIAIDEDKFLFSFYEDAIVSFDFNKVMDKIWVLIGELDSFIAREKPFKKIKENKKEAHNDLRYVAKELGRISFLLSPFLPTSAEKIQEYLKEVKIPEEALFARKELK